MTLSERIIGLMQLSVQNPAQAAKVLLAEGIPFSARSAGLLLVSVIAGILVSVQLALGPVTLDPVAATLLASPFSVAILQWLGLGLSALFVTAIGRAFAGRGSFSDALLVTVWIQLLAIALQILQLAVSFLSAALAGVVGLAGLCVLLWIMVHFVAALHGFSSRGEAVVVIVLSALCAGLVMGLGIILIFGVEAFVPNV